MRVTVDLSWEMNTEGDLAGYKIYWSAPGLAEKAVAVAGHTTSLQLSVYLNLGVMYTFAVAPYDVAGNENTPENRQVVKAVYVEKG